jgi:iron complex outermembrane receptor protein
MNFSGRAATLAALVSLPCAAMGQQDVDDKKLADADEIVVVGRSVSTSAAQVEVDREILVDTATVLKDIPGANVNSNGPITGIAQYRGMFGDRVAVDVDGLGLVAGCPNGMGTPLSYVSPMITQELIVDRGIARVSSAPEAIGGHIDASIARGEFSSGGLRLSGLLGSRFSDNGNVNTSAARLTFANRSHRVSVVAEIDSGDNVNTPAGEMRPTQLDRNRYDVSYAFDSDIASGLVFVGNQDTNDTGTPALPMDIRYIETDLYGVQFKTNIDDLVSVEGKAAYNDARHLMDNFALRQAPDMMRYRQNLTNGKGLQFSLAGVFALEQSDFRIGVDGIDAEHDSTITNPNAAMFRIDNFVDIERDVLSGFAEWTRNGEAHDWELGFRHKRVSAHSGPVGVTGLMGDMGSNARILADSFNSANRDLSWSSADVLLKYGYRMGSDTEWLFELGSKTRAPSYQELFLWLPLEATGGLADGRTYIGNLGLKEERSNEVVVGLSTTTGRVSFAPQVFFKRIDDYIQGTPSSNTTANMVATMMSGNPALEWNNVDAEIWGADLAWKVDLTDKLFLDGIATAVRGRRTDIADNLYRLAPFNGSVGLTWVANSWSLKSEVVAYAKQDKVSSYNAEQSTAAYQLVNLAFAWSPTASLRVEARVDNLLDETYQDHVTGRNRAAGSDIPIGDRLYGAERTLSAGLIYTF